MTIFEIISTLISLIALLVSGITAYKTLASKFNGELFLKPRVILTRVDQMPSIVVGFEISNTSNKSGSIDDIILIAKYSQRTNSSINTYSFLPRLMREEYNILKAYQATDFQPFESIPVPAATRFSRYIVFIPSNNSFAPQIGEVEIKVFFRKFGDEGWHNGLGQSNFPVDSNSSSTWNDAQGPTIMIETLENNKHREQLMKKIFGLGK